jgi:predicted nucleic acid-binding protein
LDASALVKLVIDEGDHILVRDFYYKHPNCHATLPCLMEALGAIKAKWVHKHISHEAYLKATRQLVIDAWGKKIRPDNVDLFTPEGLNAVEAFAKKHNLDLSDALQLETLINGTFKHFADDSRPILITADEKLAEAAKREGIRVWNCSKEPAPIEA